MSNTNTRTRNYACIVYPESAPENWLQLLDDLHIQAFVSPLHDADISADGSPKKPHYHVMTMADGVKTQKQMENMFSTFGGVGCIPLNSIRSYARYLCHLDDYNKAQYVPSQVLEFGGANYMDIIGTMSDRTNCLRQMIDYIRENQVTCFASLVDYAGLNNSMWFDCLINSGSYFIKEYIKSFAWKTNKIEEK